MIKLRKELSWEPKYKLKGLEKTFHWIEDMLINKKNDSFIFQKANYKRLF